MNDKEKIFFLEYMRLSIQEKRETLSDIIKNCNEITLDIMMDAISKKPRRIIKKDPKLIDHVSEFKLGNIYLPIRTMKKDSILIIDDQKLVRDKIVANLDEVTLNIIRNMDNKEYSSLTKEIRNKIK